MDNKNIFIGALVVALGLGYGVGSYAGKVMADSRKEYYAVSDVKVLKEAPSEIAGGVIFTPKAGDRALVVETLDYSKVNKKSPTIIRLKKDVNVKEETTKKQYQLTALEYYKVIGSENDIYLLEVASDKGNLVTLRLEKDKAIPVDQGVWKRIRFKDRSEAWVKQ